MHSPRQRDEGLLLRALDALAAGHYADALLDAESAARRQPNSVHPAVLRATILGHSRPELAARAWYRSWCRAPTDAGVQDAMLRAWLATGAAASVAELAPAFLPQRCRQRTQQSLLDLLGQAGVQQIGACWKDGDAIAGVLYRAPPQVSLCVADADGAGRHFTLPAGGGRFRIDGPHPPGPLSLSWQVDGQARLLQGSPLVFTPLAPPPPPRDGQAAGVTVVIPVYRALALVRDCIDSVLASLACNVAPVSVLVVDDASPEPALSAWLDELATAGRITLLRNAHNLGFIETCNRALRHCRDDDALLLNADTLVHGDWIDRLRTSLYSAPDIAAVTPWSNNGEISSFPRIASAAPAPGAEQLARIDDAAAALRRAGRCVDVELPACCGFAMLMRRSVLDRIGLLDGVGLERGYGEEVDWCQRARAAGYRHLAATGVFVAHSGTASFGLEKTLRVAQNRAVVSMRYPHYYPDYRRFVREDPLAAARGALRAQLATAAAPWLAQLQRGEPQRAPALRLPAPLTASCQRIAVWQHRLHAASAGRVLTLARLLARQAPGQPALRLLVIGEASEALWHTGVVDVLPAAPASEASLLSDATMVGLAGCAVLLSDSSCDAPQGIEQVALDADFEPGAWLERFRRATRASPSEDMQR